jgi:hypothetical protein
MRMVRTYRSFKLHTRNQHKCSEPCTQGEDRDAHVHKWIVCAYTAIHLSDGAKNMTLSVEEPGAMLDAYSRKRKVTKLVNWEGSPCASRAKRVPTPQLTRAPRLVRVYTTQRALRVALTVTPLDFGNRVARKKEKKV